MHPPATSFSTGSGQQSTIVQQNRSILNWPEETLRQFNGLRPCFSMVSGCFHHPGPPGYIRAYLIIQLQISTGNLVQNRIPDRKSTRLNSSHVRISYAVFCLKKKKK